MLDRDQHSEPCATLLMVIVEGLPVVEKYDTPPRVTLQMVPDGRPCSVNVTVLVTCLKVAVMVPGPVTVAAADCDLPFETVIAFLAPFQAEKANPVLGDANIVIVLPAFTYSGELGFVEPLPDGDTLNFTRNCSVYSIAWVVCEEPTLIEKQQLGVEYMVPLPPAMEAVGV